MCFLNDPFFLQITGIKSHSSDAESEQTHAVMGRADLDAQRWGRGGGPAVLIRLRLSSSGSVLSLEGKGGSRDLLESSSF